MIDLRLLKRSFKLTWQRLTRGWSDADTWSLDMTIAEFVYPRLVRYKELTEDFCYPFGMTEEEWIDILDDIIYAMWVYSSDERLFDAYEEFDIDWERVERGLKYFGEHFDQLSW
jgi:hypothetical protein